MTERSIFLTALDIDDSARRDEFVAAACGDDAGLRAQVEELLKAHLQSGGFMGRPAPLLVSTIEGESGAESAGTVIGNYKLFEQLGEGGFGVVFLAEQTEPVRRKNLIRPREDFQKLLADLKAAAKTPVKK